MKQYFININLIHSKSGKSIHNIPLILLMGFDMDPVDFNLE